MIMRIDGYTPQQFAYDLAMGWLRDIYHGHTRDLGGLSDAQRREVRRYLALLHDRLLTESRMDGLPLREEK